MYTIVADTTVLFTSSDVALVRHMFRQYQELYAWAVVSVRRVRV